MDKFVGVGVVVINEYIYFEKEVCCFLFIVVGFYFVVVVFVIEEDIKYVYVMMELCLVWSMKFIGIKFE